MATTSASRRPARKAGNCSRGTVPANAGKQQADEHAENQEVSCANLQITLREQLLQG